LIEVFSKLFNTQKQGHLDQLRVAVFCNAEWYF